MADLLPALDRRQVFVVAAVIESLDGYLVAQRLAHDRFAPGLWEFPGGKVDFGEVPEAALAREIAEELGVSIAVHGLLRLDSHVYRDLSGELHVILASYLCTVRSGLPVPKAVQAVAWVKGTDLGSLQFAAADINIVSTLLGRH